jgi:hypothetical protein
MCIEMLKNKYQLNDIVKINTFAEEYKIVGMDLDTYNKPQKIWYKLYRLSDGYVCVVAENLMQKLIKKGNINEKV